MTIEEMKKRKKELGYTNETISRLSGVPLGTVQKIFAGVTEAPRYETLQALRKVLEKQADRVMEPVTYGAAGTVKRPGEYTTEDYYALPPERRAELINGEIYDMASPSPLHQMIATEIWQSLKNYIRAQKGECIPVVAPLDVCLDCDDRTMIQPDVLVVCNRKKLLNRCVFGAPDFVAEIISDSTRSRDMYLKLEKYASAGVSEYWIVDPVKRKVIVYDLSSGDFPSIYGFDSCVPVRIFSGECMVDFGEIASYTNFLYKNDQN